MNRRSLLKRALGLFAAPKVDPTKIVGMTGAAPPRRPAAAYARCSSFHPDGFPMSICTSMAIRTKDLK